MYHAAHKLYHARGAPSGCPVSRSNTGPRSGGGGADSVPWPESSVLQRYQSQDLAGAFSGGEKRPATDGGDAVPVAKEAKSDV